MLATSIDWRVAASQMLRALRGQLRTVHQQRAAHRRVAFDAPWSEAVLRVMETAGYRKARGASGYIARRLGLSVDDERRVLAQLEAAGAIARRGAEYLDLVPISVDTSGVSAQDLQRLKAHWTQVSLQRLSTPRPEDWLGYNVISTSTADLERIREILRRSFREIRAIAAASEPAESVELTTGNVERDRHVAAEAGHQSLS